MTHNHSTSTHNIMVGVSVPQMARARSLFTCAPLRYLYFQYFAQAKGQPDQIGLFSCAPLEGGEDGERGQHRARCGSELAPAQHRATPGAGLPPLARACGAVWPLAAPRPALQPP